MVIRNMLQASLCLVLASLAMAQRTLVVDSVNGPYKTIQAAIWAASAGDIVLVRGAGPYAGAIITKGLHLLGDGTPPRVDPPLIVRGIRQGERMAIKDFRVSGGVSAVHLDNCAGSVHIDNVQIGPAMSPSFSIIDCDHVSVLDCMFSSGVSVNRSGLIAVRCSATGYSPGGAGITARASHVVTVQCQLAGSEGLCYTTGGSACYTGARAGSGILAYSGCTIITKATTMVGAGYNTSYCNCGGSTTAPGLRADAATKIIRDPATKFSWIGAQLTEQNLHDLQVVGTAPGGTVPVTMRSKVVAPYAVFASFGVKPYAGPIGAWLDVNGAVLLHADVVNGTNTIGVKSPSYLPRGLPVAFQAVVLVGGQLELSTPVVAVLH